MKKKALIFYISRYSGHYHAASAIESGIKKVAGNVEVEKINALGYTNPILGTIINKAYMEVIKKKPSIWGHIYDNPDFMKKTKRAREALHRFNMSKIKKLLEAHSPDIVFCTQAFPCGMVADYKRSSGDKTPLIGILTDHAPHSYWLFNEVDYYVVPSKETAQALERKGVSSSKIREYGIPVDPRFSQTHDKESIMKTLGLDDENPAILIMGGSQGLGSVEGVVRSLLTDKEHKYQLMVVTGSNKKLRSKLTRLNKRKGAGKIRILSFVDNIDELMEASDIIITKAGGMTTAESMVKALPMLVVNPIPGHERMNTDYLVEKGAAIEIEDFSKIHETVNELFDSKGMLKRMKENAKQLAKPNSALDIAKLVLED